MNDLKRDTLEPQRFEYLGAEDSKLYALAQNSDDEKDQLIKRLLEDKARQSRAAHCNAKK